MIPQQLIRMAKKPLQKENENPTKLLSSFDVLLNVFWHKNVENTWQRITCIYSTKLASKSSVPSCTSSRVPSSSTENSPFHFSNSNAAASSSLAFWALASSSYMKHGQACHFPINKPLESHS